MAVVLPDAPPKERPSGRPLVWAGIALTVLALVLFMGQFALKVLREPWHVPIVTTCGALLVLAALLRARTFTRILLLAALVLLAGLQWYFVAVYARLPVYVGPAQAGAAFPAFQTARADGSPFTEKDLMKGESNLLVFFRGRW